MGSGYPAAEGRWPAPDVRFFKLSSLTGAKTCEGGGRAGGVRGRCQAQLEESWPRATTEPRPSLSLRRPAHCRALQSWRGCWGSPAAPPRGCRAGSCPQGPGRAGDHAVSPQAPSPATPASASASLPSQGPGEPRRSAGTLRSLDPAGWPASRGAWVWQPGPCGSRLRRELR